MFTKITILIHIEVIEKIDIRCPIVFLRPNLNVKILVNDISCNMNVDVRMFCSTFGYLMI